MTPRSFRQFKSLSQRRLVGLVRATLREDLGRGDITTTAIIPASRHARAAIVAQERGVVAGLPVVKAVFQTFRTRLKIKTTAREGARVRPGTCVVTLFGSLRTILMGERVALNFLSRLSGIATLTRTFVETAHASTTAILDTRKTTPLLRDLEKYAVHAGGGKNHRRDLGSAVLIKDNHIAAAGSLGSAVAQARRRTNSPVEVEAQNFRQVREAVSARADIIMLDNMSTSRMKQAIKLIRRQGNAKIELSGGVTLANVRRLAGLKPDYISVGALTHSAPALDFSLDVLED